MIANILKAPPLPFVPAEQHGKPVVIALMVYAGGAEAGEQGDRADPRPRDPARRHGAADPLPGDVRGAGGPTAGVRRGDEHPRRRAARARRRRRSSSTSRPRPPAVAAVQLRVLGGAMARVPDDATAFGHRGARLMVNIAAMYQRAEERAEHEAWARGLTTALADGATPAAYVGFVGDEGEEGVRRAYPPATLERLARVKRRVRPGQPVPSQPERAGGHERDRTYGADNTLRRRSP